MLEAPQRHFVGWADCGSVFSDTRPSNRGTRAAVGAYVEQETGIVYDGEHGPLHGVHGVMARRVIAS